MLGGFTDHLRYHGATPMKFYVASSISNKDRVRSLFAELESKGHDVTTDWTLTDDIVEEQRDLKRDYMRSVVKRDCEAILESDVFILLSTPSEGRSMYVELGIAMTAYQVAQRPLVFVVGPRNNEAAFYFHPSVERAGTIEEVLDRVVQMQVGEPSSRGHEGRLEEYKALRSEMLDIMKDRTWGQATYAALAAGLLALTPPAYKVPGLIFTIALATPFLFHTIQREHARIRMGNYLRVVVEPRIPGMYWEEYLGIWRGGFGKREGQGWLNVLDRAKHILGFAGVYLLIASFCWFLLLSDTIDLVPRIVGSSFLILLLLAYAAFFKLYDRGAEEYEELWRLGPQG